MRQSLPVTERRFQKRYATALFAVTEREILKFFRQRERLLSAIIRPCLWLFVFAAGMNNLLGISIVPPYQTYTPYQEYVLPGLVGVIVLFQSMQSALSMVYDREAGVVEVMLAAPLPRSFLLLAKILAATILSTLQIMVFLSLAALLGYHMPLLGNLLILPCIALAGLTLGSIGLVVSIYARRIENFAGMMNFVIFPMFFLSSALYPLWKLRESGAGGLYLVSICNPFTHVVELVRYAAYGQINWISLLVVCLVFLVCFSMALQAYDPNSAARTRFRAKAVAS